MPANLSPEYKQAEAEYRKARETKDRLRWLHEMLRTIPKHKGTEHLQADIKTRIKQLTEESAGPRKGAARGGPPQAVHPEGAAQVALIGPPNAGKSSLLAKLTGAHTDIGPYPFTTKTPIPGMLPHEDIHFQLVDLPPVSRDFMEPWYVNALQSADAAFLVVDLADPECIDHVVAIRERLDERKVTLEETWPYPPADVGEAPSGRAAETTRAKAAVATARRPAPAGDPAEDEVPDPFRVHLPTLLLANKCDLDPDPQEVGVLEEIVGVRYPAVAVSSTSGEGLPSLGPMLFRGLGIVRVYTKAPGRPADEDRPYTLRAGATIADVARLVHRELAAGLKFARVWGSAQFEGQQVGPEHVVRDRDVVELHS
ncbi:MAG: GTPase [bacterium]